MDIWQQIGADGEAGAKRLVSEYRDRLHAAAMLLCRNPADAEDLVFRTLERAVRRIGSYRPTGSFFAWLYAIQLNFWRMDVRKARPDVVAVGSTDDLPAVPDPLGDGALAPDRIEQVEAAVRSLSPALRQTVLLRYYGDLSVAEIARRTGVPVGTVKSRLHNARRALRALLAVLLVAAVAAAGRLCAASADRAPGRRVCAAAGPFQAPALLPGWGVAGLLEPWRRRRRSFSPFGPDEASGAGRPGDKP